MRLAGIEKGGYYPYPPHRAEATASWFFALTMTFLVTPLSNVINNWTYPNFSRMLAYSSVAVTLYLTTSSSLITFPTPKNQRQLKWIKPYLSFTLGLLLFSYYFFVSRTAEWLEQPILGTAAEIIFKLVLFTFATLLCSMIAIACIRYLNQEKVVVTKYRLVTIIFTAIGGGAFFFTKTVLALSYLWHPFGADWINRYTKLSLHSAAMAGCTAVLLWTAPLIGVIIAVFALLVGWARIRLKHHTPLQILIGWILAALNDSSDDVDDFTYAMYGTDIPEDLLGDE